MKKNVLNLLVYLWFCVGGFYLIKERIVPVFGFFALFLGIYNISLMYQKWYNNQLKNPFKQHEWKLIGEITSVREGLSELWLEQRGYHPFNLPIHFDSKNHLHRSISSLNQADKYHTIDRSGETVWSPWFATKKLYWENIGKTKS